MLVSNDAKIKFCHCLDILWTSFKINNQVTMATTKHVVLIGQ
jgi:hypothetical protein